MRTDYANYAFIIARKTCLDWGRVDYKSLFKTGYFMESFFCVIPNMIRNPDCIKTLDSRFRGNDKHGVS